MKTTQIPALVQPTLCVIFMLSCAILPLFWSLGTNASAAQEIPDELARYLRPVSWPTVQILHELCVLTTVYIYTVLQHVAAAFEAFSPASSSAPPVSPFILARLPWRVLKMKSFVSSFCSLALFQTVAVGAGIPHYFPRSPTARNAATASDYLAKQLSDDTVFFGPEDAGFANATVRWSTYSVPEIQLVIQVGEESDVSTIVSVGVPIYVNELLADENEGQIL